MITPLARAQIWLTAGVTYMRKVKSGLAAFVTAALGKEPLNGDGFVFRGCCGDLIKVLWFSGDGTNLYIKRQERGRFIWPNANKGTAMLSSA